jgi:type II secretion system protein I
MRRAEGGFMMMEAVVMTIIVAVGMAGVFQAVSLSIEASELSEAGMIAEEIGQMKMSEIELSPMMRMGDREGAVVCGGREYAWKTSVEEGREPGLCLARVKVDCVVRGRKRTHRLATLVRMASEGQ